MPTYDFQCTDCETRDLRIAAFWEDEATCVRCGGLMLRLNDPFTCPPEGQIVLGDEVEAKS